VEEVLGEKGNFEVRTPKGVYRGGNVVVATGFYGQENLLEVPGEELPKVRHYYKEAHPHAFRDVLVVGGGNSAVDVALETWRAGARVTMVVRYPEIKPSVKYWVRPDIVNRIASGEIAAFFESEVREIREREVVIETPEGIRTIANDVVFAMIGYHPHFEMMRAFGIRLTEDAVRMPVFDPVTLETNRPGVFVAGVVCGGMDTSSLFIENSRVHAQQIAEAITGAG
jgi:Thioredoxin reductase